MPYPDDPLFRQRTLELLGRVFPRLPAAVVRARDWGADWCAVSTPFTTIVDGEVVAHVGVLEMPLRVGGRDVTVAGVHAVGVDPRWRGGGHMRRAMEPALAFVDAHWTAALLWTDLPDLYRRFGFRPFDEPAFAADLPGAGARRVERLDLGATGDLERLRVALARRAPVSAESGTREPGWHFLIDLALAPELLDDLVVLEDLDAIVVAEPIAGGVRIHDVVAPQIPPLREILARLERPGPRVEVLFSPDCLEAPELRPAPHPDPGPLMVRGDLQLDRLGRFAFPPLARC